MRVELKEINERLRKKGINTKVYLRIKGKPENNYDQKEVLDGAGHRHKRIK